MISLFKTLKLTPCMRFVVLFVVVFLFLFFVVVVLLCCSYSTYAY